MNMNIVISGVPGTGKTNISHRLARELNFDYISVNHVVEKFDLVLEKDEKKHTKIVDTEDLKKAFKKLMPYNTVIDGHLAYVVDCDYCIILRCDPVELKKRLEEKDWSEEKIMENVQSEILGHTTVKALEEQNWDNVHEIDTSNKEKEDVVNDIKLLLEGKKKFPAGNIDWMEKYEDWLK